MTFTSSTDINRPAPRAPEIRLQDGEVRALFRGHLIAASKAVFVVRHADEPPQYYFPKDDVETSVLRENGARFASSLGEAAWQTLYRDREIIEDAAWTYAAPSAGAEQLAHLVTFNRDYVDIEFDVAGPAPESPIISDYIRHTDSGSGQSQETAWSPTVKTPSEF